MILIDTLLVIFSYLLGISGALHALFKTREPRSALIWVAVCLLIPIIGVLLYAIFGVNRVKRVTQNWHSRGFLQLLHEDEGEHKALSHDFPNAYKIWIESGDRLIKEPVQMGCEFIPLFDGKEAYPEMLAAIRSAKESIFLVTYIFSSHGFGAEIIDALAEAVERKVEVKVLIDGVGALYTWPSAYRQLKRKRVPVRLFLSPFHSLRGILLLNMRNHAKILTVDGKIGFTGGMNILDEPIHDLHFKCTGPILGELQDTFFDLWYFSAREIPKERLLLYDDTPRGNAIARGIDNGPYQDFPHILVRLIESINQAKKHVRIMTPYFVVGNVLNWTLIAARLRGIEVELILPENNNLSFVKGATEANLPPLLKYGIKVYYSQGEFAHTKVSMVDDIYVFLGSSNLDTRSFLLNFEFNVEVFDAKLAGQLISYFDSVKKNSRRITNAWLRQQNFIVKFRNACFKLFSPYL